MAVATFSVVANTVIRDNTQKYEIIRGQLQLSAFGDTYPANGIPIAASLAAALSPTGPLKYLQMTGTAGYIYTFIPSTGVVQVLQIPPTGSLTTAAPLQQIPSAANSLSGVFNDTILFEAGYLRNAQASF